MDRRIFGPFTESFTSVLLKPSLYFFLVLASFKGSHTESLEPSSFPGGFFLTFLFIEPILLFVKNILKWISVESDIGRGPTSITESSLSVTERGETYPFRVDSRGP